MGIFSFFSHGERNRAAKIRHIEKNGSQTPLDVYLVQLLKERYQKQLTRIWGADPENISRIYHAACDPNLSRHENVCVHMAHALAQADITLELVQERFVGLYNMKELAKNLNIENPDEHQPETLGAAYRQIMRTLIDWDGSSQDRDELDRYTKSTLEEYYQSYLDLYEPEDLRNATPRQLFERIQEADMLPGDYILGDGQKDRLALCALWDPDSSFGRNILSVAYAMSVVDACEDADYSEQQKDTIMKEVSDPLWDSIPDGPLTHSSLRLIEMMHRALYTKRSFNYDPRPIVLSFMFAVNMHKYEDDPSEADRILDRPEMFEKAMAPYLFFYGAMTVYAKIENAASSAERLALMHACEKADLLAYSTLAAALIEDYTGLEACANNAIKLFRLLTEYNQGEETLFMLITEYLDGNRRHGFDDLCVEWDNDLALRMLEIVGAPVPEQMKPLLQKTETAPKAPAPAQNAPASAGQETSSRSSRRRASSDRGQAPSVAPPNPSKAGSASTSVKPLNPYSAEGAAAIVRRETKEPEPTSRRRRRTTSQAQSSSLNEDDPDVLFADL